MDLILDKTYIVNKVFKKTTAKIFKDLVVGDKINFSVTLCAAGQNRGKTYATYIKITNLQTEETNLLSFNELGRYLHYFEFGELYYHGN
ncbi:MAG: hypothetical protein RBT49_08560 [Bacteroidales bacterium]|jgi:hypothetical protein|nr:hypothetical protein [Bacteroidales bacterium]